VDLVFVIARSTLVLVAGAAWLGAAAWVAWDARRRLRSEAHARLAALGVLLMPVAGIFLYLLLRPQESLLERRERRAVRRLLELELDGGERCLVCRTPVRPEFRCCPGCGELVGTPCSGCGEPLRFGWTMCPHCVTPVTAPAHLRVAA
jgi:hypothetical protein